MRSLPRYVPFLLPKSSSTVPPGRHDEPGVTAGDGRGVEPHVGVGIASDDVLPCGQRKALPTPLEPARWALRFRLSRRPRSDRGVAAERVAESMHGPHEHRRPRAGHQARHESRRPGSKDWLRRQRCRATAVAAVPPWRELSGVPATSVEQQLERLGGEVNLTAFPVSCLVSGLRLNGPKRTLTTGSLEKPCEVPGRVLRLGICLGGGMLPDESSPSP